MVRSAQLCQILYINALRVTDSVCQQVSTE
jgi:hypothetical protein